ncbi:MAG: tRNA (guanine(46)-N(7))-methyltransferase TrmB [Ilumatobacteraceae bacterium]
MIESPTSSTARVPTAARSFRPRRRRLSATLDAALRVHGATYLLDDVGPLLSLEALFPVHDAVILDIGFGAGEGLLGMLEADPAQAVIGVEVHTPGVARVVAEAAAAGWGHVRVVHGDVVEFVDRLAPGSLSGVRVWYPDPWPKQRQRHRRLLDAAMLARVADLLRPGGVLHVVTDIDDYGRDVAALASLDGRFDGGVIERPRWRPATRFEQRAEREGRSSTELWFVRRVDSDG